MKHQFSRIAAAATAIAFVLLVAACGGKETVASRSAKAFRKAQQKGVSAGGGEQRGPAAGEEQATMTDQSKMSGMDHSTMTGMGDSTTTGPAAMSGMGHSKMNMEGKGSMAGMDHSNMPGMQRGPSMAGMDRSQMQQGQQPMAGMDHSRMQQGQQPMAGMDHSQMQQGQQPMAGMDHSQMQQGQQQPMARMDHSQMQQGQQQPMAGMDHSNMPGMQQGAAAAPVGTPPPTTSAEIRKIRPAATLKNDPFDAPAPAALAEAAKAVRGGGDEGLARGITPGEDRENPPTPAPPIRDIPPQGTTAAAPAMGHSQNGAQPSPRTQSRTTMSSQTQPAAAAVYSCPMHPEVTGDKPGTCPKDGMALMKKQ